MDELVSIKYQTKSLFRKFVFHSFYPVSILDDIKHI